MFTDIKKFLGFESVEEKIERYREIQKSFSESDIVLDQLAKDFFIEKSLFERRMKDPDNYTIQSRIQEKYDSFIDNHKQEIRKAKKQYDSLKKEREKLEKEEFIKSMIDKNKKQIAYEKIKKAYQDRQISLDSFNQIIKSLTKEEKTKYADFLLFNENGELLLLKRSAWEDDNQGAWVIPGGHVDPGEDFEQAAIRELREESGFNVIECQNVGSYEDDKCQIEYFQSTIDTKEQPVLLDVFETRDYRWVKLEDLEEYPMIFNMADNVRRVLGLNRFKPHKEIIKKAILEGLIPIESIEKARSGIYKPTAENKKLGRVGQKYGNKKEITEEDKLEKNLRKVEIKISKLHYECAYCFDKNGDELFNTTDNDPSGVQLYKYEDKLENNILTHNHPKGNAHSLADIVICLSYNISEYRCATNNSMYGEGVYILENKINEKVDVSEYYDEIGKIKAEWDKTINSSNFKKKDKEGWLEIFKSSSLYADNKNSIRFYFKGNDDKIKEL